MQPKRSPVWRGGTGGTPTLTAIAVTSPTVGTAMAIGRTAQLSAAATDGDGSPMSTTFTWTSTNEATATVSASGSVTAVAAGTTTIRAVSGSVTGSLSILVVDADLAGITAALTDAFVVSMGSGLDASTASTVNGLISTCAGHITSGNLLGVDQCLAGLSGTTGANGTDQALLAVLALFVDHAMRLLQL